MRILRREKFSAFLSAIFLILLPLCCASSTPVAAQVAAPQGRDAEYWQSRAFEHQGRGETQEAIAAWGKAVAFWRASEKPLFEAASHNHLGTLLRKLGRLDEATQEFEAAERLSLRGRWYRGLAAARNNLARVALDRGHLDEAREGFEKALEIAEKAPQDNRRARQTATILENLVRLMTVLGREEDALGLLGRALQIRRNLPGQEGLAGTLSEIAWLQILAEQHHKALLFLNRALELVEGDGELEVVLQDRRGTALEGLGEVAAAHRAYTRAREVAEERGGPRSLAGVLVNLCRLKVLHPSLDRASSPCGPALEILRQRGATPNALAGALYWAGRYWRRDDLDKAIEVLAEAAALTESLRFHLAPGATRDRFYADRQVYQRLYVELLMERSLRGSKAHWGGLAFEASERLRARGLLDLLVAAEVDFFASAAPALRKRWEQLNEELYQLQRSRAGRDPEDAMPRYLEQEIDRVLAQLERVDHKLQESNPWYADLARPLPAGVAEIQQQLDKRTVLLSVILGETKSLLWKVDRQRIESFVLDIDPNELSLWAREFSAALGDSQGTWNRARWLYLGERLREALTPVEGFFEDLAGKRLVFLGEGALRDLPLSALPMVGSTLEKPRFLVETNAVVHLPSASTLVTLRNLAAQRPMAPNAALFLGDPVYLADQRSEATATLRLEPFPESTLDTYFPAGRPAAVAGRLPFTGDEVEKARASFGGRPVEVALGPQASRQLVLGPEMRLYRILHIASHGWLDLERPDLSALVLSELTPEGKPVDGHLRVRDFTGLRWNAELVVASACQTGLGKDGYAEGVTGLARGILEAGARRAMVSLWQVDSLSTALLMEQFYHHLVVEEQDPAEALRQARLALLHGVVGGEGTWAPPKYWAAFVLIGDWRAFSFP